RQHRRPHGPGGHRRRARGRGFPQGRLVPADRPLPERLTIEAPPLPDWIARQLPDGGSRRLVEVGGYRMHVMERGPGRPALLVHGNPTWGFLYRKVVAALRGEPLHLIE